MDGRRHGWMNGVGCRVVGKEIVSPGCARKHSMCVIAAALSGSSGGFKIERRTETSGHTDDFGRRPVQQLSVLEGSAPDLQR